MGIKICLTWNRQTKWRIIQRGYWYWACPNQRCIHCLPETISFSSSKENYQKGITQVSLRIISLLKTLSLCWKQNCRWHQGTTFCLAHLSLLSRKQEWMPWCGEAIEIRMDEHIQVKTVAISVTSGLQVTFWMPYLLSLRNPPCFRWGCLTKNSKYVWSPSFIMKKYQNFESPKTPKFYRSSSI